MKVYVVVVQDRHIDIEIAVFADKLDAIEAANNIGMENSEKYPEDREITCPDWCVYYFKYSCENDCVYVLEQEVQ